MIRQRGAIPRTTGKNHFRQVLIRNQWEAHQAVQGVQLPTEAVHLRAVNRVVRRPNHLLHQKSQANEDKPEGVSKGNHLLADLHHRWKTRTAKYLRFLVSVSVNVSGKNLFMNKIK